MNRLRLLAAAGLLAVAGAATAHSPYLLPNFFDVTQRDHVSVQGAFAEDFFQPDLAMKADDYHVVGPDGTKTALKPIYSKDLTILDVDTKVAGTYRISTGLREGSTRKAALVNGEWEFFAADEAPANAVDMRSMTRADVYVSRGAPTDAALAPTGRALELHLLTHPNRLEAAAKTRLVVLYDGKPLTHQLVVLNVARNAAGNAPAPVELRSDGKGILELPLLPAGLYYVMTRHRFAPVTAGGPAYSYTVAVTLEVAE
jgi:uncharacterized GH25 family protein